MSGFRTLGDVDVTGKTVLVRVDLNVPVEDGAVRDTTRIERAEPTIAELRDRGAAVVLLSHFGRPKGNVVPAMSLQPIAAAASAAFGCPVRFANTDWRDNVPTSKSLALAAGDVVLMENTRFAPGEEKNSPEFAAVLAELGDIYVNDAFSAAHRAHASTEGVAHLLKSVAGRAMEAELSALSNALDTPERPVVAVVGGAKISTKLELLTNLSARVDAIVVGGAMANTFLAAKGHDVGRSLCEHDLIDTARDILASACVNRCDIVLPVDVVVAKEFKAQAPHRTTTIDDVGSDDMILDLGAASMDALKPRFAEAATVVWNGPLGAFEIPPFDRATNIAAQTVAELTSQGKLLSVAGGGDTVAALNNAGVSDRFSYISTAGGAFLEWLEGKPLPGVDILRCASN